MARIRFDIPESVLVRKLLVKLALFALGLILFSTVAAGMTIYVYEMKAFDTRVQNIHESYGDVIRNALWIDDRENLEIALMGIGRLPGITNAHIHFEDGRVLGKAIGPENHLERFHGFPITHTYDGRRFDLGTLHVLESRSYIFSKILTAIVVTSAIQSLTIILVCLMISFVGYRIVIRRLLKLTNFMSSLTSQSLAKPLAWNPHDRASDELDELARVVDEMRENLHKAFARKNAIEEQLKHHHHALETAVARRTSSLRKSNEELAREMIERKAIEEERERLIVDLQKALDEVKQLGGMLPICSHCKKIRDDKGYWRQVECYIRQHSEAEFSHGICPDCVARHYPDFDIPTP